MAALKEALLFCFLFVQNDLDSIKFWLRTNQLSLNVLKSHVMLISSWQKLWNSDLCVSINGRQLFRVPSLKYLGVYVDDHLTWQKHTQYFYQRVQSRLHCLYRLYPLSNTLLRRLYCAFILPILDYCDIVWSPSSVQYFKRFECVHSKFWSLLSATQNFFIEFDKFPAIRQYFPIKIFHSVSYLPPINLWRSSST